MSSDENRLYEAIHDILFYEWDPIGVNEYPEALGEYDNYIGGVRHLLDVGSGKVKIVGHLRQLEEVCMGLPVRDDACRLRVAESLLQLVVKKTS